jgi:2-amino-4-hydroxy-6-hydroxymethyldihydropteridine diphosphokinase
MSLILSTGANLGDREKYLNTAKFKLCEYFELIDESNIYESPAVDYLNQPDFLNQLLEFSIPTIDPIDVLRIVNEIENELGRTRDIDKGPRTLDIDILFWELDRIDIPDLKVPHPRLFERSFIVSPLKELSYFSQLLTQYEFQDNFDNTCWVYPKP